jgi:hypothetical protein
MPSWTPVTNNAWKASQVQNSGHFSCEPRDSSIKQVVVESVDTARIELCLHCNRYCAGTKEQITAVVKMYLGVMISFKRPI